MGRFALAAMLGLFLAQAAIGFPAVGSELCGATCFDEGPEGRCPPVCDDCSCCTSSTRTFVVGPEPCAPPAPSRWALPAPECRGAAAGEPRDVFHVP